MEFKTVMTKKKSLFQLCKTKKFKGVTIYLAFIGKISKQEVTALTLLSRILRYCNAKYKTTQALNSQRELLYDVNVGIASQVIGNVNVFSFALSFINPELIKDENYNYRNLFSFFMSFFKPYSDVKNTRFNNHIFNLCKDNYHNKLDKLDEDKELYSYLKLLDMIREEDASISSVGYLSDLEKLTNAECYKHLEKILKRPLYIYAIGDINRMVVSNFVDRNFKNSNFNRMNIQLEPLYHQKSLIEQIEEKELSQSMLGVSFTTKVIKYSKDYYPMILLNSIFGDSSFSKLFMTIREKYGLCYSIYSNYDSANGTIFVMAGINEKSKSKTLALIIKQLGKIKKGQVSAKEFRLAKQRLISESIAVIDSPIGLIFSKFDQDLFNVNLSVKEEIKKIDAIKKEDVIRVCKDIKIKDCFFLKQISEVSKDERI